MFNLRFVSMSFAYPFFLSCRIEEHTFEIVLVNVAAKRVPVGREDQ